MRGNAGIRNGRIVRPNRNGENAEIRMYLSKLKDLVPNMPDDISKHELIEYVIDYISVLKSALDATGAGGGARAVAANFDVNAVLNGSLAASGRDVVRQPLGVRSSPNQIHYRRSSSQLSNVSSTSTSSSRSNSSSSSSTDSSLNSSNPCDKHTTTERDERNGDWSS